MFQFIPEVLDGVAVRAQCKPVKFFNTKLNKCTDLALCVETGKGQTQTSATKMEAQYCLNFAVISLFLARPQMTFVIFI